MGVFSALATFLQTRQSREVQDPSHSPLWMSSFSCNYIIMTRPCLARTTSRHLFLLQGHLYIALRSVAVTPVRYGFTLNTNDAESFSHHVLLAIFSGWLLYGDILVLDNANIHNGGLNLDLENWLWSNFRIYLLYLPASTPEWNPIELVWNIIVQRLNVFCIDLAKPNGWQEQPQPCCWISYCLR